MPYLLIFCCCCLSGLSAQWALPIDTVGRAVLPMSETVQRRTAGGATAYFANGASLPFTGVLYGTYDNGQYLSVQEYKDGLGNGFWIDFDPDGRINCRGTYVDNRVEGPVVFYYEDGSVKSRGQYRHWKRPIGWWTYYDRQGKVVHRTRYTR